MERIRSEIEKIDRRRGDRVSRAWWWRELGQDVRYAGRGLRKSPGFASIAILTLALGIGASTTIFTLVNSVLLRPLQYSDPERLMMVWETSPGGNAENLVSPAHFTDWREQAGSFTGMAAVHGGPVNLTGSGEAAQLLGQWTTDNFFQLLGADAEIGRTYMDGEELQLLAVLSQDLWQRRFGGDAGVIGQTIELDGESRLVIGVMPADFRSIGVKPDVWMPRDLDPEWHGRFLQVVGRSASADRLL